MKHHPNILLIIAERMRYDCIGSSQMRLSNTPYLDWLAGNGVWFEQAYTPHPNFSLALSTLLTGKRVNAGTDLDDNFCGLAGSSDESITSWSRWLRDQKWLCSWLGEWRIPGTAPEDYGYTNVEIKAGSHPVEIADVAVDWLRDNGQQGLPWHLCLSFPDYVSDHYEQTSDNQTVPMTPWPNFSDDMSNKPIAQKRLQARNATGQNLWSDWADRAANSNKQATRLDKALGILVSQINQMGLLEDTLIIFTAASGSMCGSHKLAGNQYCCYEEIMKVPMVFHWPGVIPSGLRCDKMVSTLLDIPATLSALLDYSNASQYHGFDLSCLWNEADSDEECSREGVLASQLGLSYGLYSQRMFRDERFKYVWNPTDIDELYDLQKDPYELINRINENNEEMNNLRNLMIAEMQRCQDPMYQVLKQEQ